MLSSKAVHPGVEVHASLAQEAQLADQEFDQEFRPAPEVLEPNSRKEHAVQEQADASSIPPRSHDALDTYQDGFVVLHDGEYVGRMGRVIGRGAMGTVRIFLMRRRSNIDMEVAVKAVRADFSSAKRAAMEKDLAHEASAAFAIGRHALVASLIRMVVPLPGLESTAKNMLLFIDFVDAGDLELMMGTRQTYRRGRLYTEEGQARWPMASISLQIYLAFHHIHACAILHQVLRSRYDSCVPLSFSTVFFFTVRHCHFRLSFLIPL